MPIALPKRGGTRSKRRFVRDSRKQRAAVVLHTWILGLHFFFFCISFDVCLGGSCAVVLSFLPVTSLAVLCFMFVAQPFIMRKRKPQFLPVLPSSDLSGWISSRRCVWVTAGGKVAPSWSCRYPGIKGIL